MTYLVRDNVRLGLVFEGYGVLEQLHELVAGQTAGLAVGVALGSRGGPLADDQALQHQLAIGAVQHAAVHTVFRYQPQYQYRLLLPDPVYSVHGLHRPDRVR